MDLGTMGLEGLGGLDSGFSGLSSFSEAKLKLFGSDGFLEQERPGFVEDDWRNSKMAKTVDFSAIKEVGRNRMLRSDSCFSDDQKKEQMLVFASSNSSRSLSVEKSSLDAALPCIHHKCAGSSRHEVHECGILNYGVASAEQRGPFTQSQWMELGNQALIYKYITSNVPVPSHLLLPIRKAIHSAASSGFSGGFLKPSSFGWGSFHVGFNNADPEPGRCRRTDGKKWRCSREAVANQKYCERHINRGRHRSRKPVEGLAGHSVAGNSIARNNATKLTSFPLVSAVVAGGESYNSLAFTDQQRRTVLSQPSAPSQIERMLMNREKANTASIDVQSSAIPLFIQKHQISFQESERSGFGTVSSESLFNPCFEDCQFANATKNQDHQSTISWPDLEFESEITQLTMSSSFPPSEKPSLSHGSSDCLKMSLGTGRMWETSIGGPLGEVLHQTNNNGDPTIGTGVFR